MAEMEQWERDWRHGERSGWSDATGYVVELARERSANAAEFELLMEVYNRLMAERDVRLPAPPPRESKNV